MKPRHEYVVQAGLKNGYSSSNLSLKLRAEHQFIEVGKQVLNPRVGSGRVFVVQAGSKDKFTKFTYENFLGTLFFTSERLRLNQMRFG